MPWNIQLQDGVVMVSSGWDPAGTWTPCERCPNPGRGKLCALTQPRLRHVVGTHACG